MRSQVTDKGGTSTDIFEQWLDNSWQKKAHDRKEIMDAKRAACICPACPSYNRCADENKELIYCVTSKSQLCISEDRGCTCRKCLVMLELGLIYHDFCVKGSEAAQRYDHEVH